MFRFASRLFSARTHTARRKPVVRQVRLGVEGLEARDVPSAMSLVGSANIAGLNQQVAVIHTLPVVQVPNLAGYSFDLISSNGKPAHTLAIQSETFNCDGSATITGTWTGMGANGGTPHQILNGKLYFDAQGNVKMSFAWANGSGSQNTFLGTLTRVQNTSYSGAYIYGFHYHLDGDVTSPTGGGPGHVSGDAYPPPLLLRA